MQTTNRAAATFGLAAGLLLASFGLASAADLGSKRAAKPAPAAAEPAVRNFDWTGFYLGVNGGLGQENSGWTLTSDGFKTGQDVIGGVVGSHTGFLRQFGRWVAGIDVDADWANARGTASCNAPVFCTTNIKGLEALQARLGVAQGSWLLYATGGMAWEQIERRVTSTKNPNFLEIAGPETSRGWVIGAGVDTALTSNVTFGLNYQHYMFGSENLSFFDQTTGKAQDNTDFAAQAINVIEARLSFKFGCSERHTPLK